MQAVLEPVAASVPVILVYVVGLLMLGILTSLAIALRRTPAQHRPEIIRALAELMHFWRRR